MNKTETRICHTFSRDLEKLNIRQKKEKITEDVNVNINQIKDYEVENSNLINQIKDFDMTIKDNYLFFSHQRIGLLYIIQDLIFIEPVRFEKFNDRCGLIKNEEKDKFLCFYGYQIVPNSPTPILSLLYYFFVDKIEKMFTITRKDRKNEITVEKVICNKKSNLFIFLFQDGYIKIIYWKDFRNENTKQELEFAFKEKIKKIGIQKYTNNNMLNLVMMTESEIYFKENINMNNPGENNLTSWISVLQGVFLNFEVVENKEDIFVVQRKGDENELFRYDIIAKEKIFSVKFSGMFIDLLRHNNYAVIHISDNFKINTDSQTDLENRVSDNLLIYDMKNEYLAFKFNKKNTIIYKIFIKENEVYIVLPDAKNTGKEIYKIKDTSDQEKLDKFMKRTFFDLAEKFAENQQNIELKLQICKEAGDHFYNKNNFEKAIENYIKTIQALELKLKNIRDFEPCVIIKKFLDMNQLSYLIQYLEALHKSEKYTVNIHQSSLLVHSYLKQKDIKGLKEWFVQYKRRTDETIEMTVNACLEYEEVELAKIFAEITKKNNLYISISIENSFYGEENSEKLKNEVAMILEFINKIENSEEKVLFLKDNGNLLFPYQPKMLIDMIIEHLKQLKTKNSKNFSMDGLWDVFQNILECYKFEEMEALIDFLKKNLKDFEKGKKETAGFIINYYILKYENAKTEDEKNKYLKNIDNFIEDDKLRRIVDNVYLIFIFTKMNMKKQKLEIMKKMGKKKEIIEILFEDEDYKECMELCKTYKTNLDSDLPVYFLKLICEKNNKKSSQQNSVPNETESEDEKEKIRNDFIPELLEMIAKEDQYSLHFIIKLLKQNTSLKLMHIKKYFLDFIKMKNKIIDKKKEKYFSLKETIHNEQKKLLKLKTSPNVFQPTNCFACKSKANNPVVYFFCGHIYHFNCIEDYSCHECQLEHNEIIEKRELFEKEKVMLKDLSKVDFDNCVDYFEKFKF